MGTRPQMHKPLMLIATVAGIVPIAGLWDRPDSGRAASAVVGHPDDVVEDVSDWGDQKDPEKLVRFAAEKL
jgi:hypothetical protein